jgi:hypothetical protein
MLLLGIFLSLFGGSKTAVIAAGMPEKLSTDSGLDEDAALWGVFTEGNPTWAFNNVVSPSLDGRSLRCALTGGNPYSNVHCYRNLPPDATSNVFTLGFSFYYQPVSTFNNNGGPSVVQALEFTMNKWHQGLRYEWALQWDNVDTGGPKWRYWGRNSSGGPLDWYDLGITSSLSGQEWHTLVLEGQILAGKVHYKRFIIDGQEYPLDIMVTPEPTNEPDKLAIAVQLDGNSTQTPYEVFLDQVTFEHLSVPPGAATLTSPTGNIDNNRTPVYTWTVVPTATWYYLWINGSSGNLFKQWYESSAICSGTTCSVTPVGLTLGNGNYTWWVQTWNEGGYGPWSSGMDFNIPVPALPGKATLVSPTNNIGTNKPTYTWNAVAGATWYYLWVDGPSGNVIKQWYTSAQANCNGNTCSVTPNRNLSAGAHKWWIQTWNEGGYGPWSNAMTFTPSPPGKATLLSPSNTITDRTPLYRWNQVSDATWYYLWVNGPSGNVIKQWYTSEQANCDGTTCSVMPSTTLGSGAHTWWIQTWNEAGDGPWSASESFSVP